MGQIIIKGGKIWNNDMFTANKELTCGLNSEDDITVQLEEEDLIIPGMIDFHAHLWAPPAISTFGIASEKHYAEGFVAGVDAGTYGINDWEAANQYWQNTNNLRVKSFVSLLPEGLTIFPPVTPTKPDDISIEDYVDFVNRNKSDLLGVKFQLGWLNYKSPETDQIMIEKCREISDRTNTNMMIHISGQCMNAVDSANYMQRNDIITHPYSGFANTILDVNGKVYREVFDAKDRGVLFDVGHAGKHFSWNVFKKAYAEGIKFDTIGGDIGEVNYRSEKWPIWDLFHVISGFLNYGVDLDETFRAVITTPAQYIGMKMDVQEHCLVLKKVFGETMSIDGLGEGISCSYEYRPKIVIHEGNLLQR